MDLLDRVAWSVSRAAVWAGGGMLLLSAVFVAFEVVLRKMFVVSVGSANEMSSYALAISASWAFTFTLLHRSHIRIDVIYRTCPARVRAVLDVLALLSLAAFAALLNWHVFAVLETSVRISATSNTPLSTPLWMPQSLWLLGFVILLLVSGLQLVRALRALVSGDIAGLHRVAGPMGARDELEEELASAGARRERSE